MTAFLSFRRSGAPNPTPGRPWRSRRVLLAMLALSVSWKALLLGVGGTMAAVLVDDGLAGVPTELQPYAMQAREVARTLWAGPIERISVRGIRVMSVERLADQRAAACGGLSARVRAYTFFAIPYSEVRTVCDRGTVEYRVLPHRARAD